MSDKKIVAFVGRIASGKGTAAGYLHDRYGAEVFTFSDILRDVLQRLKLEETRDTFIKLSEILRGAFGEDLLSKIIADEATGAASSIVAIDGTRRKTDVLHLKDQPGFVLVAINTDPKVRYERLIQRNVKADDQTKTYEEFLADEQRSTEVSINEIIDSASHQIDNNGDLEALYKQLDDLIASLDG